MNCAGLDSVVRVAKRGRHRPFTSLETERVLHNGLGMCISMASIVFPKAIYCKSAHQGKYLKTTSIGIAGDYKLFVLGPEMEYIQAIYPMRSWICSVV